MLHRDDISADAKPVEAGQGNAAGEAPSLRRWTEPLRSMFRQQSMSKSRRKGSQSIGIGLGPLGETA
jgi:hypothetical protein